MARKAVRYAVVDAFTDTPFKGNPAVVCWLGPSPSSPGQYGDEWMQSVAAEFNLMTVFVAGAAGSPEGGPPRFHLRWFTPVAEVKICGHLTLAASHFLLTSGFARGSMIEFDTKSGILIAKKTNRQGNSDFSNGEVFSIELNFPVIPIVDCVVPEIPYIPKSLNGASMVNVKKTASGDIIVELASGEEVADVQPDFDELRKCAGRGIIITGPAPTNSGFDIYSRFFCPKLGINEDPVCGSAHCTLAPYWGEKMGKNKFIAYMASPRGGRLDLQLEEDMQRVRIQGGAIIVMEGTIMV